MSFQEEFPTEAEQIEEIYRYIKKQRISNWFELTWKWGIRISVIASLAYVFYNPSFVSDLELDKKITSIVGPMASSITQDMIRSGQFGGQLPAVWSTQTTQDSKPNTGGQCILLTDHNTVVLPSGIEVPIKK